jgi:uncharacterized membrane protein
MAKAKGSLIGAVGSILIGAAILLFVATIVLNSLKDAAAPGNYNGNSSEAIANRAEWNETNSTVDQLKTFLTISSILLGVLGITMIGAAIIGYIGGAFGGT